MLSNRIKILVNIQKRMDTTTASLNNIFPKHMESLMGGGIKKFLGPLSLLAFLGAIGVSVYVGVDCWHNFKERTSTLQPPDSLMIGIVTFIIAISILSIDVLYNLFKSIIALFTAGGTRVIMLGGIIGILIFFFLLHAKFTGQVVYGKDLQGNDTATCADGKVLFRDASANCGFKTNECGDGRGQTIWQWWQIIALTIVSSLLVPGWFFLAYTTQFGMV